MYVIRHQDICVEFAAVFLEPCAQPMQVELVIFGVEKAGVTAMPALNYVQRNSCKLDAMRACHTRSILILPPHTLR
jgi:hypothetical protein